MKSLLGKLFLAIGSTKHKHKQRVRKGNYDGKWINRGDIYDEQWDWVEKGKKFQPLYINVHSILDDYVIIVSKRESPKSIDTMKCTSQLQLDASIRVYSKHYGKLGKVVIARDEEKSD
ncbi:hypothetical protein EalM132_00144 [Exiguobacterium phage vB_EalM-132]|nr:hypothetical protein EalM132_00144 [Exiguobacterium phage vB_EalM-132]